MAEETKVATISPFMQELAGKLSNGIDIDKEGGLSGNADLYIETLAEEHRPHLDAIQEHDANFGPALLLAARDKSLSVMKEHGVKRISGSVQAGRASYAVNITAPTSRRADGSMKDPVVTVIRRQEEHKDYGAIRSSVYDGYRKLAD